MYESARRLVGGFAQRKRAGW